ncbi:MAG: hypothetical protein WA220_01890 [Candidatus Nitrosopolaris sp.]
MPSKNEDPQRKYHGTVKIPPETHIETADLLTIMEYLKLLLTKRSRQSRKERQ